LPVRGLITFVIPPKDEENIPVPVAIRNMNTCPGAKMNRIFCLIASTMIAGSGPQTASAQYQGWQHSGSLYILTTLEGANLPATASESGFPLLVRLDKNWFNFSQAKSHGEDIRFTTSAGKPLAHQVEQWDAAGGTASIWVRIPAIRGNARQEIKIFWARPMPRPSPTAPPCSTPRTDMPASSTWTRR